MTSIEGLGWRTTPSPGTAWTRATRTAGWTSAPGRCAAGTCRTPRRLPGERPGPADRTANEGDARDWPGSADEGRLRGNTTSATLAIPGYEAATLRDNANLGRLNISLTDGEDAAACGAPSTPRWPVGVDLDDVRAARVGQRRHDRADDPDSTSARSPAATSTSSNDDDAFDGRSDNKGPEPEGVAVGTVDGPHVRFRRAGAPGRRHDVRRDPAGVARADLVDHRRDDTRAAPGPDSSPEVIHFVPRGGARRTRRWSWSPTRSRHRHPLPGGLTQVRRAGGGAAAPVPVRPRHSRVRRPPPSCARSPTPIRSRCWRSSPATRTRRSCTAPSPTSGGATPCWRLEPFAVLTCRDGLVAVDGRPGRGRPLRGAARRSSTAFPAGAGAGRRPVRRRRHRLPRLRARPPPRAGAPAAARRHGLRPRWSCCFCDLVVALRQRRASGLDRLERAPRGRPARARAPRAGAAATTPSSASPPSRRARRAAGPRPARARDRIGVHARRLRGRRAAGDRVRPRRRLLPGEPVPALPRRLPDDCRRSTSTAGSAPQPGPVRRLLRPGRLRRRLVVAGAVPAARRPAGRDAADQGHPAPRRDPRRGRRAGRRAAASAEGPGRERDDRRPAAQRPGRVCAVRHRARCRRSARSRRSATVITSSRRCRGELRPGLGRRSTCCGRRSPAGR